MNKFFTIAVLAGRHGLSWREALALLQTLTHLRNVLHEKEVVLIEGPRASARYVAVFPIVQPGFMKLKLCADDNQPTFICTTVAASSRELQSNQAMQPFLVSDTFSCFERIPNNASRQIKPTLSQAEATDVFVYLREALDEWKSNRTAVSWKIRPPSVFRMMRSGPTGVALWVDGELRGSAIAEQGHFDETLEVALHAALSDTRFLPLSDAEVARAEIELSRISPIGLRMWRTHAPRNDVAYRFSSRRGVDAGWYLPEVFLARQFSSPEEFFESLATEKARSKIKSGFIETRVVEDWLGGPAGEPRRLLGGSPAHAADWLDSSVAMERIVRDSLAWLEIIQHEDGSMPRSIHPQTGRPQGFDIDRMAHMLLVLQEVASTFPSLKNNQVEVKLRRCIDAAWENKRLGPTALMYYARVLLLEGNKKADRVTRDALAMRYRFAKDDLLLSSHLLWLTNAFPNMLPQGQHMAVQIIEFLSSPALHTKNPAIYAEAVLSLQPINPSIARQTVATLCAIQNADGSFPGAGKYRMPYVRGTAKVFEVLAADPSLWSSHARPALAWILSFQITPASAHWVLPKLQHVAVGGIRHDTLDQSLWIDAVGHTILGCARRARHLKITA